MAAKDDLGRLGERLAEGELTRAGIEVIGRNWRCADGELDLIGIEGRTLVVCEVKTRSTGRYGAPIEAVTPAKALRIRRLAAIYQRTHSVRAADVRFDVVSVIAPRGYRPQIEHVRGVF